MSASFNILLVEDSPDDVFFFRRAVNKAGIVADTHVAVDGLEAIKFLNTDAPSEPGGPPSRTPRIMFLDLKLPHVNGFEVLEWIRANPNRRVPPIVVLSSSDEPEDRDKAASLGASLFLTKPPMPDQLREVFQRIAGL